MDFIKPQVENINFNKNIIIIFLIILLVLSFLGINIFIIIGNLINIIVQLVGPFLVNILSLFGYTVGSTIETSTDILTNVTKTGIDVAGGTIHSISDLLKNASTNNVDPSIKNVLDNKLNTGSQPATKKEGFDNDYSFNSLQNPISCNKNNWSLINDDKYVTLNKQNETLTGQIFPTQKMALNPTLTP